VLGRTYAYIVKWQGEPNNSSSSTLSQFKTYPVDQSEWAPRLALFGDLGWTDNQVLPFLRDECAAGAIDAIVIFGDMVYWDNGENENSFMRDMSALSNTGAVPVMVSPGNGDYGGGGYKRYKVQWSMPGWRDAGSLYHSFDLGRAHIVGINTEALEYGVPDPAEKARMLAWLEADMLAANQPTVRAVRPWIVVHFHRPAYTTGNSDSIPYAEFEPLMYKYGVDVVFAGQSTRFADISTFFARARSRMMDLPVYYALPHNHQLNS
jgi:hypothetical protein